MHETFGACVCQSWLGAENVLCMGCWDGIDAHTSTSWVLLGDHGLDIIVLDFMSCDVAYPFCNISQAFELVQFSTFGDGPTQDGFMGIEEKKGYFVLFLNPYPLYLFCQSR